MGSDIHAKPFSENTITKLEIFESYLRDWLPVFIQSGHKHINIIDFFAGSGTDTIGQLGSPLRILRVLEKYANEFAKRQISVRVILNELNKQKFASLAESVKSVGGNAHVQVKFYNNEFRLLFDSIKGSIQSTPTLLFLDQNGVKEIDKSIFLELCGFSKTDFLFFISSSFITRFKDQKGFQERCGWMNLNLKDSRNVHREVLDAYKKLLPTGTERFLIPFSIKKGRNIYGLVFCANHILAADKFLQILWKQNSTNGEANFDIDQDNEKLQGDLFETPKMTKIEVFSDALEKYILSKEKLTNKDVYLYTIQAGFLPSHAKDVLDRMKNEGNIERFKYSYIGYNQCFKDQHVVVFRKRVN